MRDAGLQSVAWRFKSKELHLAQIGSGAARGPSRTTSAGIFSRNGWLGRPPRAQATTRQKCLNFPGDQRRRPALGNQQQQGATGHPLSPWRPPPPPPRSLRSTAHTPSLLPTQPKFLVLGHQAAASGATALGPRVWADFTVWLSGPAVFEVGHQVCRSSVTAHLITRSTPVRPHWEAPAGLCNRHPAGIQTFRRLFPKYLKVVNERFLKDGAEVTRETESCSSLRDVSARVRK